MNKVNTNLVFIITLLAKLISVLKDVVILRSKEKNFYHSTKQIYNFLKECVYKMDIIHAKKSCIR